MSVKEPGPHELFVRELATKRRKQHWYILDGFDHWFYLVFDFDKADGSKPDTCDVLIQKVGSFPCDNAGVPVVRNATQMQVIRFLFALGVSRFSEDTREKLYKSNSIIRTQKH